jgi:hypothetical protein
MEMENEFWNERFTGKEDNRIVKAIKRVYNSFPRECMPKGICDPMYIMNVIAFELGIGDGRGNFNLPKEK